MLCLLQTKVARNAKYLPDFSKAFQHVLIHPGAKIVIDQVCPPAGHIEYAHGCGQISVHATAMHAV